MSFQHIYQLPAINAETDLQQQDFLANYGLPNQPVLLKTAMQDCLAMKNWDWSYFKQHYGNKTIFVYQTGNRDNYRQTAFADYIDYCLHSQEAQPYYLLDWFVKYNCPELATQYKIADYLKSWTDHLPQWIRPNFLSLYIGPQNSASPLHIDILSTSAWNAVFRGKKLWVFYPPQQAKNLYHGKVNPFYPDRNRYPLFDKAQGFYAEQNAGDVIFTPSGWWHAVINIESTISLTDNFINRSNAAKFVKNFIPATAHLIKRTWVRRKQVYNR